MFIFGIAIQFLFYTCLSFLTPTLAIHLNTYSLDTTMISIFFALPALMYILGAMALPCLSGLVSRRCIIFVACALLVLGVFLVGSSPLLKMRDTPKTIFSGLMVLGIAGSAISIPVLPEMLDSITQVYPGLRNSQEVNDVTAGFFNGFLGIGETAGPLLASVLVPSMGFRSACDGLALTLLVYTLLFFIFNGASDIFLGQGTEYVSTDADLNTTDEGSEVASSDDILSRKATQRITLLRQQHRLNCEHGGETPANTFNNMEQGSVY